MGMVMTMLTVSDATIKKLQADPSALQAIFDAMGTERDASQDEGIEGDLDKAWHGLHYLLTGTAADGEGPLASLLHGGVKIGDEEYGYDVPRAMTANEVQSFHEALARMDVKTLRGRYDPRAMHKAEIYPQIWTNEGEAGFDYLIENLDILKKFTGAAVQRRMGMLLALM